MLKLTLRKKKVEILHETAPLFDSLLLKAFGIGMSFHLILLLLFHVSPFKVDLTSTLFAPIEVQIETPSAEGAVAETESERIRRKTWLEPQLTQLALLGPEIQPAVLIENPYSAIDPFPIEPFAAKSAPSHELHLSGELALLPLLSDELPEPLPIDPDRRRTARFQVRVLGESGRIFWFEPLEVEPTLQKWAEQTLSSLRFEPNSALFAISGEVTIIGVP